jgi:hypothetical protein
MGCLQLVMQRGATSFSRGTPLGGLSLGLLPSISMGDIDLLKD